MASTHPANPADESIGGLFHRLVDDGRTFVRSEIDVQKQTALLRVNRLKPGLIEVAAGGVIALIGSVLLLIALAIGLGDLLDSRFLGFLLTAALLLAVAIALLLIGKKNIAKATAQGGNV